ncbi:hypothetical protein [Paenibacillus sp. ACRRY]|uniref:hypothetical protein n=1 Tax=Paenibacillus sp. ACRRY TaxID=2918208 RepID=UPI001EF60C94|nr:hypothetical protein [Paenibacillus sp. ACRRY]MCG7385124.1 hypothetical protein [Paenibacillus sp. ACRRY]
MPNLTMTNYQGNVEAKATVEVEGGNNKSLNNLTKMTVVGLTVIANMIYPASTHVQQGNNLTANRTTGINSVVGGYTSIKTTELTGSTNGELEAMEVRRISRNNSFDFNAELEYHNKLPSNPRIDITENFEIKPMKHLKESEVKFSLEYAGRLPKRPRI